MDFEIGCTLFSCSRDVLRCYILSAELHLTRDREQRLQLAGDFRAFESMLYIEDQLFVTAKMMRRDGAVDGLAEAAIVLRRYYVAINSRSPGDKVCGPRNSRSTSSFIGFAVSGRNIMGPRIPGSPSGSCI